MDAKKFGAFVAGCRKEKNMTQADLAMKINVTDKAVSRWERGIGFPDINTIEPLASALEISVLELMKSERIISNEVTKETAEGIVADTLNAARLQQKAIGLTRVLLVLFAGTNILYTLGQGDRVLQFLCTAGILIMAVLLSFSIWKSSNRIYQAIMQGLYCGITVLIAFGLSRFVGNIITSILIIAIAAVYIRFLK